MQRLVTLALVLVFVAGFAFGGAVAPEIDASTGVAGFTLLSGGMLVLRARRRKK